MSAPRAPRRPAFAIPAARAIPVRVPRETVTGSWPWRDHRTVEESSASAGGAGGLSGKGGENDG